MDISELTWLACVLSALCCPADSLAPCPVGFMPPECQDQCGPGSFGVKCASLCPATCMGGVCRPDTGFCYRCQAGFTGPKCSLKCRTGFFGEGCKKSCPSNCFQKACDPFTGLCERCLKGYGGAKCEQRAVLLNSSVQSQMVDDSPARGTSTDKSIAVYVLVVVVCCVFPVCAVVLCVKCAKKLSSRNVQQDEKAPTSNHTPVSLSTHARRPGRLTLKYEQMQTIEEESSNQLTLDEDIDQRAASNAAAASATTMNRHAGFFTPSQNYTFESLQAMALNATNRRIHSNDLYNYQSLSKDCKPDTDFSHTTKEIKGFEAGDVYKQSNDVCIQLQSTPVLDSGNDAPNNQILTNYRSHKTAQASFVDNEQCIYDNDASVLSLNSDTFLVCPYSPTSGTHIELPPEMSRRVQSSAIAESHMELISETPRRVPSLAIAESRMELASETPIRVQSSAMAESRMVLASETPRLGPRSAIAESHTGLASEMSRRDSSSAMAETHMKFTSEAPGCILAAAFTRTHAESACKAAMRVLPRASSVVDVHPIGHLDPQMTVRILRSECYSSSQEFMPRQGFTQDPECADLAWHQARATRQADSADRDVVALDLPAHTGASNQEYTSHDAAPVPFVEEKNLGNPVVAQSVGQPTLSEVDQSVGEPTLSDNDHVLTADALPKFSTGVCPRERTPGATGVHTADGMSTPGVPPDNEESEPGDRMRSLASLASLVSDNRPVVAAVSSPVSMPVSPAASIPATPVCTAVSIRSSPAVCIPASLAVCTAVSIRPSPAVCIPVPIPATHADCIPVSFPVSADVTTAVLQCCHVMEEGQIVLDGSAQDATCRHIRSIDYTHLRVRHAFECATGGYNVLQDAALNDLAVEVENIQDPEHDDQHSGVVCEPAGHTISSGNVCEPAGHTISSGTEQDASANDVSINGSANNTNRWYVQTRQPQSSCTSSPSTRSREMRRTPFIHLGCTEPMKYSVSKDTLMSHTSVPLFSICSSAPVNLKVTYCREAHDFQNPTRRHPAPKFASLSSLDLVDDCPPQSCEPLELSIRLSSPPKHCQMECSKGRHSGEFRRDLETQTCLHGSKPDRNHQHKLPAFSKCDQFRQVLYKYTPCRQRGISLRHLSVGKDSRTMKQTCRRCRAPSVAVNKKNPHGSHVSNCACPFVTVSRPLDENPPRKNVVPETRNIESLTPPSAIKMSLTQTPDRDVPQLHTSIHGTESLPSTLTDDQKVQQSEPSPALKPLTFYVVETPLTSKDIGPLGPRVDKRTSNLSKNSHFLLTQGLRHEGDLRRPGSDELARTPGFPNTGLLPAMGQPTDGIRNSSQVFSNTASSSPDDTTRQATIINDSAKVKSCHVACQRSTTETIYCPHLRELGSSQHRSPTVTIDPPAVRDDPNMMAKLSASDSRRAGPPSSSPHEVNVEGRQAEEMKATQVKVQGNMSTTDTINQSGTPGHELPPNMYSGYVTLQHNPQETDNCTHKAKSETGVPRILKSADLDPLILYPLPSLLEGLTIWERTVTAVETNTEPCLLPVQHCNTKVGHPATERTIMKTTDYGRRLSDGNIVCLNLCSQDSELSYQFSPHDDNRVKAKQTICSSHQNIDGAAPGSMVGHKRTPHLPADNSERFHRLSEYCKSKSCNKLSPETTLCCRKGSTEGIQLTQEQPFSCSKISSGGCQLPQDKPVHCKNSCSERNQLLQQKPLCRRKKSLEGIHLSQVKIQCFRHDNSEDIQLSQDSCQCCRRDISQSNKLRKEKLKCCLQDSSEYISMAEDSCDIFFDALDSLPVAFPPSANFQLQGHNDGVIITTKDRKRAVKFMETSAMKTFDVDFSAKSREQVSRRQWTEASHTDNERLNYSLSKRQTPQQNIAFRFAVPGSADRTMSTIQTSATTTAARKRRFKRMYPTEEKDQVASQPTNQHGQVTSAKVSSCEQTEQRTRPFAKNSHSGYKTSCGLVGVEGTDSALYCSVASEKDADQQSVAEEFFSICE